VSTLIHTSDGGTVHLNSRAQDMVGVFARALDEQQSVQNANGTTLPKGFVELNPSDGGTQWVNVAEITRIEES